MFQGIDSLVLQYISTDYVTRILGRFFWCSHAVYRFQNSSVCCQPSFKLAMKLQAMQLSFGVRCLHVGNNLQRLSQPANGLLVKMVQYTEICNDSGVVWPLMSNSVCISFMPSIRDGQSVGISTGCASVRNVPLCLECRYIPYFLLFSFILQAVGPILSFSPFIL